MKLKFLLQIPAAALLVFCLSSCDGGGVEVEVKAGITTIHSI